jgi:hypothetical protein
MGALKLHTEQNYTGLRVVYGGLYEERKSVQRFLNVDPHAASYPSLSGYSAFANNPINVIDPDGRDIIGVTKQDAKNFKEDVHKVLAGDKFAGVRALIDVKGKSFKHIDGAALTKALDGVTLSADERTYVDVVTNTINAKEVHKIEYLTEAVTSSEGATAFKDHMNKTQAGAGDMMLTPEGNLSSSIVDRLVGLNVPTKEGSHSFISSKVAANERAVTSGHELFGHGIPSSKGLTAAENNSNAIRTDNLVRRLLGLPERDGKNHGGYNEGHITEPNKLPLTNK